MSPKQRRTRGLAGGGITITTARLGAALEEWRRHLGSPFVITDQAALASAGTATYATSQRIPAILRPGSREDVQTCVRIANRYGVPLYPVSTGKNWGYGSTVPLTDGCVLVELTRLNRIVDFDEQLGYLTVEPGVTFQQAFDYLRRRSSKLLLSASGASPDASLIGQTVERGLGVGRLADRLASTCGFEVILPTGECVRTGFERFPSAAAAKVHRWGLGPHLDGLFTQSNLGIVTQMTFWLQPCPERIQVVYFGLNDEAGFDRLVDGLQRQAMHGLLTPALTLFNDFRFFAAQEQYPWEAVGGQPLRPNLLRLLIRQAAPFGVPLGAWQGDVAFFAHSEDEARVHLQLLEHELRPLVDSWTVVEASQPELLDLLKRGAEPAAVTGADSPLRGMLLRKYLGVPQSGGLRQLYWRKRVPAPADIDPHRDRCGVIWMSPVVPFASPHVRAAVDAVTIATLDAGFEPAITLQCVSERHVVLITSLHYDREIPGEDERAADWHRDLAGRLRESGYYPYRQSTLALAQSGEGSGAYEELLRTLKRALDPNDILAPGRYIDIAPALERRDQSDFHGRQ
ncbi:MAG: FAD-binding oxidoreductase [Chloroflexi bacterium]|nr:FAD-binding oxidoreductase [Chloroflexota bacterium]